MATGPKQARGADVAGIGEELRQKVQQFVGSLTREERMLVVLKRELYESDWDEMVADLQARLEGRPYIFKLAHRITDDLERISRLRQFEQSSGVDLCDHVEMDK